MLAHLEQAEHVSAVYSLKTKVRKLSKEVKTEYWLYFLLFSNENKPVGHRCNEL